MLQTVWLLRVKNGGNSSLKEHFSGQNLIQITTNLDIQPNLEKPLSFSS